MLKKNMRLRKVRKYPAPKYPVVEEGQVLFRPRELNVEKLLRDVTAPLMPLVLSTTVWTQSAAAEGPSGNRPGSATVLTEGALASSSQTLPADDDADSPYRVRQFTRQQVQGLIKQLGLQMQIPRDVKGEVALISAPLTESQGRQILERFFSMNGIRMKRNVPFAKGGVELNLDGYSTEKKIGFEFLPIKGDPELNPKELARMRKGLEGGKVVLIQASSCKLPTPTQSIMRLQELAAQYLNRLYLTGVLGRDQEIRTHIRSLVSDDANDRARAEGALLEIGPEALWRIHLTIRDLGEMLRYAEKPDRMRGHRIRFETLARRITEKNILPLLRQLDDSEIEVRDAAQEKLSAMGGVARSSIREFLKKAKKDGNLEVVARCEKLLK